MKVLYTAHATSKGGRAGHVETDDKILSFDLGSAGAGGKTNPEQLFACGYAACFGSAVEAVAKRDKHNIGTVSVTADVTLNQGDDGYSIGATLTLAIEGADKALVEQIMAEAHKMCPYSKATRGNVDVQLKAGGQAKAA